MNEICNADLVHLDDATKIPQDVVLGCGETKGHIPGTGSLWGMDCPSVATLHLNSVNSVLASDAGSDPRTTTQNLKGDQDYCSM